MARQVIADSEFSGAWNLGAWLDVGCPVLGNNADAGYRSWLERSTKISMPDGYGRAFARRQALLGQTDGGVRDGVTKLFRLTARGRIVVGIGAASAWENNIALLRPWGVPFLAGSGLKGLASSTAHLTGGDKWRRLPETEQGPEQGEHHGLLFGNTKRAGLVTFHDAWPDPNRTEPLVDLDVVTVHHREYYGGKAGEGPMDWDEPNPVAFLTTRGSFLCALSGPPAWVDLAAEILKQGLDELGLGAKTHAGYGRMDMEEWSEQTAREANRGRQLEHGSKQQNPGAARPAVAASGSIAVGNTVLATLAEERTKKGGWKATVGGRTGVIQNSAAVPEGKKPGDKVYLIVKIAKKDEVAFAWDASLPGNQ